MARASKAIAKPWPVFARRAPEERQRPSPARHVSAALALALLTGAGGILWIVARADSTHKKQAAHSAKAGGKGAGRQPSAAPVVLAHQGETTSSTTPVVEPVDNTAHRRPLSYYTQGIRGGMFSAPQPPAPRTPKVRVVHRKPPVKPPPTPKVMPIEINPFADWSYTGTIKFGNQIMALLENTKTHEGQYLTVGQSFLGAQVEAITDQMVTLRVAGRPYMVAKSDTITTTPLDKGAGGGQPGGPGMPSPGVPQPGMPPPPPPPQTGGDGEGGDGQGVQGVLEIQGLSDGPVRLTITP